MSVKIFFSNLHYKKKLNLFELLLSPLLISASFFYTIVVLIRNFLYEKNILKGVKVDSFVISIGNLTTGGTGKTPISASLANYLSEEGNSVAIVSRGYASTINNKLPAVISNGEKIFFNAKQAGDEPFWLAQNTKNVQILTCLKRLKAVKFLLKNYKNDFIILDDGFQHRALKRDIDIVVVDSDKKFSNNLTLPMGALREPLSSLKRADKIVVVSKNGGDANEFKQELIKKYNKPVILCSMEIDKIYDIDDINKTPQTLEDGPLAFCAIGQPEQFYNYINIKNIETKSFEDHHKYSQKDIDELEKLAKNKGIKSLITTEKDAVKIIDLKRELKYYVLKLKPDIDFKELLNA